MLNKFIAVVLLALVGCGSVDSETGAGGSSGSTGTGGGSGGVYERQNDPSCGGGVVTNPRLACNGGTCVGTSCCLGCVNGDGKCVGGEAASDCGGGGQDCHVCTGSNFPFCAPSSGGSLPAGSRYCSDAPVCTSGCLYMSAWCNQDGSLCKSP